MAEQSEQYYWGNEKQYGPFCMGEDGFPAAGEVIRHYRVQIKHMRAKRLGELYGKALGEAPKSREWVLLMERTNNVPNDITRRRVLQQILSIPPALLGLASLLETSAIDADNKISPSPSASRTSPHMPTTLNSELLAEYQQSLSQYFAGYYHRHGRAALDDVQITAQQLARLVRNSPERLQHAGLTLISRYYQFGINAAREQCDWDRSFFYARNAIESAAEAHKEKSDYDTMAIAHYRSGITSFEKSISTQTNDLGPAASQLDQALVFAQQANPVVKGFVSLEWALVHAYRAQTEDEKSKVLKLLDEGFKGMEWCGRIEDDHYINYSHSWYYITQAEALAALKRYPDALGALELAEEATPITLPRRFAYIDALRAKSYIGLREYEEATEVAIDSLKESRAVKSEFNIARIAAIYQQLNAYHIGERLGKELKKTHRHLVTQ